MTLLNVIMDKTKTTRECVDYLMTLRLLASTVVCSKCTAQMALSPRKSISDGWLWRCSSSQCRTTVSIKKGSFFENMHISLSKYILVIYYWSQNVSSQNTVQFTGVSRKSVGNIFAFLREICSKQLIDSPTPLGEPGKTVQIDDSLFSRTPKPNRVRQPQTDAWVFGMVDTSTSPARGYMQLV